MLNECSEREPCSWSRRRWSEAFLKCRVAALDESGSHSCFKSTLPRNKHKELPHPQECRLFSPPLPSLHRLLPHSCAAFGEGWSERSSSVWIARFLISVQFKSVQKLFFRFEKGFLVKTGRQTEIRHYLNLGLEKPPV